MCGVGGGDGEGGGKGGDCVDQWKYSDDGQGDAGVCGEWSDGGGGRQDCCDWEDGGGFACVREQGKFGFRSRFSLDSARYFFPHFSTSFLFPSSVSVLLFSNLEGRKQWSRITIMKSLHI